MQLSTQFAPDGSRAFTLVELLLALAAIAILAAIATPAYSQYRDRMRVMRAIADIAAMQALIERFHTENFRFPDTLVEAGIVNDEDPYGHAYVYLNFATLKGKGAVRKDRNLNPLNTEYDLYSKGKDGVSKPQLSNKDSLDDIVRAMDGSFIDVAANF